MKKEPPADHQFKPGRSGNPKGRPPKSERAWSMREFHRDIMKELNEEMAVPANGRAQRMSKFRIVIRNAINLAAKGDIQAMRFVMQVASEAAKGLAMADLRRANNLNDLENDALPGSVSPELESIVRELLRLARRKSRN